jgi:polysaccharide chain length determinant protein (PEP-CTERM system associated)
MDNTPAFHPLDYVSVLRRRMWWLLVPLALAIITGAALAMYLPRTYQADATIGVSLPGVSGQLLNDTQRVTAEERARQISQTLLSQAVIERVVREEGFDTHMPIPAAVQQVRSNVEVKVPQPDANMPPGSVEQFQLFYKDATPAMAQRVTNRLADVFVEESSRKREVRAEETSMFINDQLNASKMRLDQLETDLRSAKEAFMGALPEQTQANVQLVTGLQQQLESVTNAIRGDQDRLTSVERQISALTTGSVTDPSSGVTTPAAPSPALARVATLEGALAAARSRYSDIHPEVQRLKDELAKAQADARAEAAQPDSDRRAMLRADPNYRDLLKEQEDIKLRVADSQRRQAAIQQQIAMYRERVDAAPRVEQQLAAVQREYDLEKLNYSTLTGKLRDARMNESLERNQGGERFTVLQHASLPTEPFSPNVPRLLVLVLLVGACLGGGLALGREYLDRAIYDSRALIELELPILGEIPRIAPNL